MFVDRAYNAINHMEVFCVVCGNRRFHHNFDQENKEARWLLAMEKARSMVTISHL